MNAARFYVAAQFLLILAFAAAVFLGPPALDVPEGYRGAGLVLCVAGLVIIATALWAMGRVMQVSPEPKSEGHLVTRGIYGWLRHPMYTGILLIVVGLGMRQPSLLVGVAGGALIALLFMKARYEERLLGVRYPDYAAYRARTWGVLPPIR
jgi:protein-S-isoprenylcysteine O-methyltransferase Ste14